MYKSKPGGTASVKPGQSLNCSGGILLACRSLAPMFQVPTQTRRLPLDPDFLIAMREGSAADSDPECVIDEAVADMTASMREVKFSSEVIADLREGVEAIEAVAVSMVSSRGRGDIWPDILSEAVPSL